MKLTIEEGAGGDVMVVLTRHDQLHGADRLHALLFDAYCALHVPVVLLHHSVDGEAAFA